MNRWDLPYFTLAAAIAIIMLGAAVILPGCVTYKSVLTERVLSPIYLDDGTPVMNPDTGGFLYEESLFKLSANARAYLWAKIEPGAMDVYYNGQEDYFDLYFGTQAKGLAADVPTEAMSAVVEGVVSGLVP